MKKKRESGIVTSIAGLLGSNATRLIATAIVTCTVDGFFII